jgi:acetylornithine deacetylase/succinyl-diaminopimelate desuccinylase-like protein
MADEEVQAGYGLDWLLANDKISCDEAIVPDIAGEMVEINVAEKGRALLRVTAAGKAAHAMDPGRGVSAIFGMAEVLRKIEKMRMPHKKHAILGAPTLNVGIVRGGNAANAVPDRAEIVVDVRFVPGQTERKIVKQVRDLCKEVAAKRKGLKLAVSTERGARPISVAGSAPIVQAILRHVPRAKIVGTGGGTFAHPLVERGIAAVGWSPGNQKTYHQPNEEISVAQLTEFAGKLAAVTLDRMNEA